ncbi:MAG: hypothetical protein LBI02_02310 [Opitutaceae bacterium]|nr:hypothetical protein [Opitutaceae bacterium]
MDVIRGRLDNPIVIVPPTVNIELGFEAASAPGSATGKAAITAMRQLRPAWGFKPVNLVPVGHGIVECVADKIRARGYLPEEERNDSHIIVEAALLDCTLLVTSDAHMLDAPQGPLRLLLSAHDLAAPLIVSPRKLARAFFR